MEIGTVSLVDLVTFLIALVSLCVAVCAYCRTKSNELFALRQSIVVKSEQVRSGWHGLNRENESVIKEVQLRFPTDLPEVSLLLDYLLGQREHLKLCLVDASATAEDIHRNVEKFGEKKCREYLREMDPSLEMLSRNQGVTKGRFEELISRMEAKSR